MAFWGLLSRPIVAGTPGVNDPGGLGVHPAKPGSKVRYGDILQAAAQYGGRQKVNMSMQPPAFGELLPQNQLKPPGNDMGDIMSIFGAWFGGGA